MKGASLSLAAYFVYSMAISAAYASDSCPDAPGTSADNGAVQSTPTTKPRFKPLSDGPKGAFVG